MDKKTWKQKLLIIGYVITLIGIFIGGIFLFSNNNMRDGILNLDLNISKDKVSQEITNVEEFKGYFNQYLSYLNSASKDTDFYEAKNYKETEDKYIVSLHTRRVDKLKGLGVIRYNLSESYFVHDTNAIDEFENIYNGNFREKLTRVYSDKSEGTFIKYSSDENYKVNILDKDTGLPLSLDEAVNLVSAQGSKFISFSLIDLEFVDSISFKVDGRFKFVSTLVGEDGNYNNITTEGNKITITPIKVKAVSTVLGSVETNLFIGYFAYYQNISPVLLSAIISGSILVLTGLYFGIFKGYFKKIFCLKNFKKLFKFRYLFILIIPALACLIIFRYLPMTYLSAGFMEYDLLEGLNSEWVGLKHFQRIFMAENTKEMYRIFRNTIFISVIRIVSNIPFILFLAMVINGMKQKKVKTVFQSLSLIPYFLSWVAVGGLFYSLLNSESGLINRLLGLTTDWYHISEPWWALLSLSSLWKGMGWSAIIYIAAMCSIDPEQYEAARIDGCGPIRQAFTVTLPGIMGVVCLQLILDTANIMRDNYDQIFAMINGQTIGTIQETVDVVGRISYTSLRDGNFGSATAIGLIQGAIGCALVVITNKIVKKTDNEGIM